MDLTPDEEAAFVSQVHEGDRAAFEELYKAYAAPVYGFIRARSDNDDHARDIAQNTWLKLWETRIRTFDPARGRLLPFLKGTAWKTLADFYDDLGPKPVGEPDPQEEPAISELVGKVRPGTIRGLPPAIIEDLILRLTLGGTSPPHQLICFVFAERLGWKPREIVAKVSEVPLRSLEETLENEYIATSELSSEVIRRRFKPLRDSMVRLLNDVVKERKTRELCMAFLDNVVGGTVLKQYYTRDPAQDIAAWCYAVTRRAKAELAGESRRLTTKRA